MGQEGWDVVGWGRRDGTQRDGAGGLGVVGWGRRDEAGGTGHSGLDSRVRHGRTQQPHLLGLQQADGHVATAEDLPEGRPEAPLVGRQRQALGVTETFGGHPGDALHQHWGGGMAPLSTHRGGPCHPPTPRACPGTHFPGPGQ